MLWLKSTGGRSFRKGSVSNMIWLWERFKSFKQETARPVLYFHQSFIVVQMENALKEKSPEAGKLRRDFYKITDEKCWAPDPGQRKGWLLGICMWSIGQVRRWGKG